MKGRSQHSLISSQDYMVISGGEYEIRISRGVGESKVVSARASSPDFRVSFILTLCPF